MTVHLFHKAPPSEDFTFTSYGAFILNKPLNYNLAPRYDFIVTAKVSAALLHLVQNTAVFKRDGVMIPLFALYRITGA